MKLIYIKQDNDIHIIIYKEACAEAPRKKKAATLPQPYFPTYEWHCLPLNITCSLSILPEPVR